MKTEEAVAKLIGVCRRQPPGTSAQRVEAFLTQLAKQDVSASTQNQAFNAMVFFYKQHRF